MNYPHTPLVSGAFEIFWSLLSGFVALILILVAIGLIVLLVRFLLVGTRAAQLYIANNTANTTADPTAQTPTVQTPPVQTPPATGPAAKRPPRTPPVA